MFPLTPHVERFAVGESLLLSPTIAAEGKRIPVTVESSRTHQGRHLLSLDRISDRTTAEQRAGWYLVIPRAEAEASREEDEFFLYSLAGRAVRTVDDRPLGEVQDVLEVNGGTLLEIRCADGVRRLLPFVREFVHEVQDDAVIVAPPAGWEEL